MPVLQIFLLLFFIAGWLFLLHHLSSLLLFSHTNLPSWLEQAPQNRLNQASDFSCVQPQVVSAALRSRNKIVIIQLSTSLRLLKLSALRMARTQICTTMERGYKSGKIQHSIWNKCEFHYSAQLDITDCKGNHVQSLFEGLPCINWPKHTVWIMLKLNLTLPVKAEAELVVAQLVSVGVDKQTSEHRIACKTSSGEEASLTRTSTTWEFIGVK